MSDSNAVTINLSGLEAGAYSYSFSLCNDFFSALDGAEIKAGRIDVSVEMATTDGKTFSLTVATRGSVEVVCSRCLAPMQQPIDAQSELLAVLGEGETDGDDVVRVPESSGILDLSWYVYEQIALAVPIRHVHEEGGCDPRMAATLRQFAPDGDTTSGASATDPRWDALKKLKN